MMHNLYKEQKLQPAIDPGGLLEAFLGLPPELRRYLMCFLWFPPTAIRKKREMIYLWMAHPYVIREDHANMIFDELIAKGFIIPVNQKCTLVPDSCMMSQSLRSSLTRELCQQNKCYMADSTSNEFLAVGFEDADFKNCVINVGAAIIDGMPLENLKILEILYLERWQTSLTHAPY